MKARSKKQKWVVGDIFAIQTKDDLYCIGQIVGHEPSVLNSVSIALFDWKVADTTTVQCDIILSRSIFSILFATRDLLDQGKWKVISNCPVAISNSQLPFEKLRASEFIGARVVGSGIINDFVNAYYGLCPWDDWNDPEYLDKMLLNPSLKPPNLIYKGKNN
jgi:hypothetical protein